MARAASAIVVLDVAALVGHAQSAVRDAPAQKPSTGVIRGRVVVAGTDVGVRKAPVTLTSPRA
jgi:hypothetical protein